MKIFDWLNSTFLSIRNGIETTIQNTHAFNDDHRNKINPASSLPMNGSVDIHGNTFGTGSSVSHDSFADQHRNHDLFNNHSSSFNDYYNHHHHDSFNNSFSHHDYHDPFRNY